MSSRRRRHARSPAASPLNDDDLLSEILLRLPLQPSSLPRASLVCKRWRRLVSDPGFFRRFRLRHRSSPPLLGFFDRFNGLSYRPTLEAPNRVPPERFSLQRDEDYDRSMSLGCRDGLMLLFLRRRPQVLVWDPFTGDQHPTAIPAAFDTKRNLINGAVLRPAGDVRHFQVVLVVADGDDQQHIQAIACVYSSKTGLWGNLISTPVPYQASDSPYHNPNLVSMDDVVLAGDSLHWKLIGNMAGILEFDLEKQSLAVIRVSVDIYGQGNSFKVMRAEGGGLGLLVVSNSDYTVQLWKRKTDCEGVASWEPGRTIELDKLLSLRLLEEKRPLRILGFAEQNNVVFLQTDIDVWMIQLESLKFKFFLKPGYFITIVHLKVSTVQEHALAVDMVGLRFWLICKMIVWLDMLFDLLIEQVSRFRFWWLRCRNGLLGAESSILCSKWRVTVYVVYTDELRSALVGNQSLGFLSSIYII